MSKLVLMYEPADMNLVSSVVEIFSGHSLGKVAIPKTYTMYGIVNTFLRNEIEHVFFSSPRLLSSILNIMFENNFVVGKNADVYKPYWGATFVIGDITFTCLPELNNIHKIPYSKYLITRYINKILNKDSYITAPNIDYTFIDAEHKPSLSKTILELFHTAKLIAIDIETAPFKTSKEFAESKLGFGMVATIHTKRKTIPTDYIAQTITCVGYTGLFTKEDGTYYSKTITIPYKGDNNYELIRLLNLTPAPKVGQNFKYDVIHLLVNDLPVYNYRYDTYGMMHSWLAELPRTLEFISGFTLRNYMYWKDESGANIYEYNGKDTHNTLWACVALLQEMPQWALDNFSENFLQIFPCIQCSLEGFAVDWEEFERKKLILQDQITETLERAQYIVDDNFNPNSPVQTKKFIQIFGLMGAESSDKKTMQKFGDLSEWHSMLVSLVTDYRKALKEFSTYYNFPFLGDRWLFDLDPFGTETGRYASKSSSLWVGQQGQNFPASARSPYIHDEGYKLGGADNEQSESRCTAYISEDANLIDAVENSADFHKTNASLFFGIPVAEITKEIRTLGKRVNHGANYNMGAQVLIESMGRKAVIHAKHVLKLPASWDLKKVALHLLECFDQAYPDIKKKYYVEVINEIEKTGKLVGATGWTRMCFGNPRTHKPALNAYVAHAPQSLSVKIINRAFFKIWVELQHRKKLIRLKMQKHDEIIWQNFPENDWVGEEISRIMAEPTKVRGRVMVIPNEPEVGKNNWGEIGG